MSLALYYDDATGALKGFVRNAAGGWILAVDVTDSTFTTMRYISIRYSGTSSARVILPMSAWSD